MKTIFFKIIFSIAVVSFLFSCDTQTKTINETAEVKDKMDWWKDAKFGMFIHWGLYSQTAGYWDGHIAKGNEHFMIHERISLKEYATIANDFNPVKFNAEDWVLTAKNAGMKYMVITSKHHDGFALYDSPSNGYNIKELTPYGKDPMIELVEACRKHDMKFGFYYSLGRDWEDPDTPTNWPFKGGRSNIVDYPDEDAKVFNRYFERKVVPQVKELLTQYGTIDILWFDTPEGISLEESEELRTIIDSIQPNCIVNSRIGNRKGDYKVSEQKIVKGILDQAWEACITMSKNWGYIEYDTIYKSSELMLRHLLEIVSKGGNLLLNNGPTGQGEITISAKERLAQIGDWMKINSEGIYGTQPFVIPFELLSDSIQFEHDESSDKDYTMVDVHYDGALKALSPEVRFTTKDDHLYVYACSFHKKQLLIKTLSLKNYSEIKTISILGSRKKVNWEQSEEGLQIEMPSYSENDIAITGFKIVSK